MLNANSPNRSLHASYENIARNIFSGLNLTAPSASNSATLALLRQNGYTIDRVFNDPVTDLQAVGLISTTKPPLLVFNGTSSALDEQDNRNPQGAGFGQFTQNQTAISNWLSSIASNTTKNPQRRFPDVIGHSLGGALAQQTAAALPTLISEVVTFGSFGLNSGITNKFTQNGGIAAQVTHYVISGDLVSLEGQEFIGGAAVLATYTTPAIDPQNFIDKHFTSIVGIAPNSPTTQPLNISYQEIGTAALNNPNFTYTDRDWRDLILALRQTDPQLAQGLSSRQSAESLRNQYSYFQLVNRINQSDLAGRYVYTPTRNDFNSDLKSDLLWQHTDGSIATWQMNGSIVVSANLVSKTTPDWKIAGTGDFNGDSKADLLWRNDNGAVSLWQLDGSTVTSTATIGTVSTDWKIAGTSDFNGDRQADILWRNTNTGSVALWTMNGSMVTSTAIVGTPTLDWNVAGTGDFNGDGKSDLLLQKNDGSIALWQMNGPTVSAASIIGAVTPDWKIARIGDFNGDSKSDLLFRNTNGSVAEWQMNGGAVTSISVVGTATADWKITGTGDFNGDGKADILWRNDLGGVATWQMNGNTVLSAGLTSIPTADPAWMIAAPIF